MQKEEEKIEEEIRKAKELLDNDNKKEVLDRVKKSKASITNEDRIGKKLNTINLPVYGEVSLIQVKEMETAIFNLLNSKTAFKFDDFYFTVDKIEPEFGRFNASVKAKKLPSGNIEHISYNDTNKYRGEILRLMSKFEGVIFPEGNSYFLITGVNVGLGQFSAKCVNCEY